MLFLILILLIWIYSKTFIEGMEEYNEMKRQLGETDAKINQKYIDTKTSLIFL